MGSSLLLAGDIVASRAHLERALALYNPAERRTLRTLYSLDIRVHILIFQSWALWLLGYPEAALAAVNEAVREAREMGHAATLMLALTMALFPLLFCKNYSAFSVVNDELAALANEKSALFYQGAAMVLRGALLVETDEAANAVDNLTSGIAAMRSTGTTTHIPLCCNI